MDEARRFLRYVLPGSTAVLLVIWYLWMADREWVQSGFAAVFKSENAGVSTAVGLLLGSGVVGYLLSCAHHLLYHRCSLYRSGKLVPDLRPAITRFSSEAMKKLKVWDTEGQEINSWDSRTPHEAWIVLTVLFHSNMQRGSKLEAAGSRCQSMWDLFHASGAMLVGGVLAVPMWLILHFLFAERGQSCIGWWVALIASVLVVFGMVLNTATLAKVTAALMNGIMSTFLAEQQTPVQVVCDLPARPV